MLLCPGNLAGQLNMPLGDTPLTQAAVSGGNSVNMTVIFERLLQFSNIMLQQLAALTDATAITGAVVIKDPINIFL